MKKALIFLSCAALLFAGCQKEQPAGSASEDKVAVSFTAALSDGAETKASFDGDGAGVYADQCKLQVLWNGNVFYEKTVEVSLFKAKFENILLVKDQTYDFLFWADNKDGAFYNTADLTKVKLAGTYIGGNDKRDAFSAAMNGKKPNEVFSQTIYLYRPFAQLNVIATDIPALRAQIADDDVFAASLPTKAGIKLTVPTEFNVKTGVASAPAELTYSAPIYTNPYKTATGDKNTLTMDYLFAPDSENNVVEVGFSARNETSGLADINNTFSNIPLRRNWRTNVYGALITVSGVVSVEIKPAWSGEIDR